MPQAPRFIAVSALVVLSLAGCNTQPGEQPKGQAPQVIAANEMAAMSRLRSIAVAESQYQIESGGSFATLEELVNKRFMTDPSEGKLTGYRFAVRVRPGGFEATAAPVQYGVSGRRSFFIDETRIMRGADRKGEQASSSDPEV